MRSTRKPRGVEPCPLLAQSGHSLVHCTCPLSGVKRTWASALHMSAFDSKRTALVVYYCPLGQLIAGSMYVLIVAWVYGGVFVRQ